MPGKKRTKDRIKVNELPAKDKEKVKGGKTPSPGGPVPIPYPNISSK